MEAFILRIASVALEAVVAGAAAGGALALVRKVQMALGVKDDKEGNHVHISGAR